MTDPSGTTSEPRPSSGIGPRDVALFLRKHGGLMLLLGVVTPVVAVAVSFLVPPQFLASARFVPEDDERGIQLPAQLSGAAQMLGLPLGGGRAKPPQFFAQVLTGQTMLHALLADSFAVDGTRRLLIDVLEPKGDTPRERLDDAEKELRKRIDVLIDPRNSGIITVSLEAPSPDVAAEAANRLIERLNAFLLSSRQEEAAQRRSFVETRLGEARDSLLAFEERLQSFYERNRQWEASPDLTFREGALRRRVELSQSLFLTLARELEAARLEETDPAPALRVIDRALPPLKKSRPRRSIIAVIAMLVGGTLGLTWGLVREYGHQIRV